MLSVYSISKPTCHILVTDGDGHAIRTIMVKKPYFSCHTFSEQKCEGILNDSGTLVSVNSGSECNYIKHMLLEPDLQRQGIVHSYNILELHKNVSFF